MPKGQAGGGKEVMGVASQVTRAHERTILFCVEQEALGRFCVMGKLLFREETQGSTGGNRESISGPTASTPTNHHSGLGQEESGRNG